MGRGVLAISAVALLMALAAPVKAGPAPSGAVVFAATTARQQLYTVGPDGSASTQVSYAFADQQPVYSSWAPDGRSIAYATYRGVVVVSGDGSTEQLVDGAGELRPSWSPDSGSLAYTVTDGAGAFHGRSVWMSQRDGSGRKRLGSGYLPAWSPNGSRIAAADGHDLVVYDVATGARHVEATVTGVVALPSWSPDGREIAYQESFADATIRPVARVAEADGSGDRVLGQGESPTWSPDGRQLALLRGSSESQPMALDVVRPDGTLVAQVATDAGYTFSWSPDGRQLAYTTWPGPANLAVARTDGTGTRTLVTADPNGGVMDTAWSPDGTKILLDLDHPPAGGVPPSQLFSVAVGSGSVRTLTRDGGHAQPNSSADGLRLTDVRLVHGADVVEVMNHDGSGAHAVAAGGEPALSGDGSRLAFVRGSRIVVMSSSGGNGRAVATGSWPALSPNGRRLAYLRPDGVWISRADGTHRRRVFRIVPTAPNAFAPAPAPDAPAWIDDSHIYIQTASVIVRADGSHQRYVDLSRALAGGSSHDAVAGVAPRPGGAAYAVVITGDQPRLVVLPRDSPTPTLFVTARVDARVAWHLPPHQ